MKNYIKKIMATTILSVTATGGLGCATTNTKIAQKINNGVNDFVSSINKLDYVETNNQKSNIGKIVSATNDSKFIKEVTSTSDIENTITKPSERTDTFKLYSLSSTPYISLTSDDNTFNLSIQFSTEKIETASDNIDEKINKLILKRAILMVYVNEIYNGNISLTDESRKAINAYVNVIKENASFLNGNRGMVKNQLSMANDLINSQSNDNIVNYYIIKSGEALEIRSNKIDSTISSMDSIISILENNLTPSSCYYQNNLTTSYENMISNLNNKTDENSTIAKNIAESINLITTDTTNTQNLISGNQNNTQETTSNNSNARNTTVNNSQSVNNVNPNHDKEIKTLEETNHNITNTENINQQNNLNQQNDYSKLSPSERARLRRLRRKNINSQVNNPINPTVNPGSLNKSVDKNINQASNETTLEQRRVSTQNSDRTQKNKATRVPYKISDNID